MKSKATAIIDKMYNNDPFSKWLGIERLEESAGFCKLQMTVTKEMLNGFAIAHGGITYSLSDSALAFAANSHGIQSVSIETAISHTAKVLEGDVLTATTIEKSLNSKVGIYEVVVANQDSKTIALFKGTVLRTGREWEV